MYYIRRKIEIDAAHRVPRHASKCFNIHGHRYVIEAVLQGPLIESGQQTGMVHDFGFLKQCMMDVIHDPCDHGLILSVHDHTIVNPILNGTRYVNLILNKDKEHLPVVINPSPGFKLYLIDRDPTAENLAMVWYYELEKSIEEHFQTHEPDAEVPVLHELRVWETPNCVAWYSPERRVPKSDSIHPGDERQT